MYDEHKECNEWEFVYDQSKDRGLAGVPTLMAVPTGTSAQSMGSIPGQQPRPPAIALKLICEGFAPLAVVASFCATAPRNCKDSVREHPETSASKKQPKSLRFRGRSVKLPAKVNSPSVRLSKHEVSIVERLPLIRRSSRRRFLRQLGGAGLTALAAPCSGGAKSRLCQTWREYPTNQPHHLLVSRRTTRSITTWDLPPACERLRHAFQLHQRGHAPFHFTTLTDNNNDPNRDWNAIHTGYANGQMNGWYAAGGIDYLGYWIRRTWRTLLPAPNIPSAPITAAACSARPNPTA